MDCLSPMAGVLKNAAFPSERASYSNRLNPLKRKKPWNSKASAEWTAGPATAAGLESAPFPNIMMGNS